MSYNIWHCVKYLQRSKKCRNNSGRTHYLKLMCINFQKDNKFRFQIGEKCHSTTERNCTHSVEKPHRCSQSVPIHRNCTETSVSIETRLARSQHGANSANIPRGSGATRSAARGPLAREGNHKSPLFHASLAAMHLHTHMHTLFPTSASTNTCRGL